MHVQILVAQLNIRTSLEVIACLIVTLLDIPFCIRMCKLLRWIGNHSSVTQSMVQEQGRPDINIVCEKVAFQGLTRFEDRHSLPLGVSSNFTAYSAKLLTQACCCHRMLCQLSCYCSLSRKCCCQLPGKACPAKSYTHVILELRCQLLVKLVKICKQCFLALVKHAN